MKKTELGANLVFNFREDLKKIEEEGRKAVLAKKQEVAEQTAEDLVLEQERIFRTIELMYNAVYRNPNVGTEELLMDMANGDSQGAFSPEVAQNFINAIESYRRKRQAVQNFIGENNKDPNLMFEKCFGSKPQGKVEAIEGPMSLTFRCFNDEDYFTAYTHGVIDGDLEKRKGRAKASGGTAFASVKDQRLAGCITAERVGSNFENKPIFHKIEKKISGREKNTWQTFQYPKSNDCNLVIFKVPEVGEVEAHLTRSVGDNVVKVVLIRGVPYETIADINVSAGNRIKIPLPARVHGADEWVEFSFTENDFAIFDHTKAGVGYETLEYGGDELVIKDKEASRKIRRHEEQHQFNKLFIPREEVSSTPYFEFRRLRAHALSHYGENVTVLVARKFAEIYRRKYIDNRARDEILAYTKDGSDAGDICNTLSLNRLYDYKNQDVVLDNGNLVSYETFIRINVEFLTKTLLTNGKADLYLEKDSFAVVDLGITKQWNPATDEDIVDQETHKILTQDYEKRLYRWTRLVKNLKDAGYSKEAIVSFLGILPINRWHSSVRRLLKHHGLRPIDKDKRKEQNTTEEVPD